MVREARGRARGAREARTSSQGDAHGTHDVGGGLTTRRDVTRGGHPWGCEQVENRDDMMTTLCRFMSSFGCTESVWSVQNATRRATGIASTDDDGSRRGAMPRIPRDPARGGRHADGTGQSHRSRPRGARCDSLLQLWVRRMPPGRAADAKMARCFPRGGRTFRVRLR